MRKYIPYIVMAVLTTLVILTLIHTVVYPVRNAAIPYDKPFGPITRDNSACFEIPDSVGRLDRISILMGTYGRDNRCRVDFYIKVNDREVYRKVIPSALFMKDNEYLTIDNIGIDVASGDDIKLYIESPDAADNNAVTVWTSTAGELSGSYAYNTKTKEIVPYEGNICFFIPDEMSLSDKLNSNIDGLKATGLIYVLLAGITILAVVLVREIYDPVFPETPREDTY